MYMYTRERPGRQRVTTPRQDRHIFRQHRKLPATHTAASLMDPNWFISSDIVRRRLRFSTLYKFRLNIIKITVYAGSRITDSGDYNKTMPSSFLVNQDST